MTRIAPKPANFEALSDCWNNPEAYAREVNAYYEQLSREGLTDGTFHWTERLDD